VACAPAPHRDAGDGHLEKAWQNAAGEAEQRWKLLADMLESEWTQPLAPGRRRQQTQQRGAEPGLSPGYSARASKVSEGSSTRSM
jgi:hypothetical protein